MSVKDYLATKASALVLANALTGVKSAVGLATVVSLGKTKASEFAEEVVALVSSKEFVAR